MCCTWNPGSIFSRDEDKASLGNQTLDLALHIGGDSRRVTVSLGNLVPPETAFNVQSGKSTFL
ncbi:hypothetical protein [Deinococcus hopiensis]|uniref:Uncharacterized protein n=1 Tax=Deinococcus hopiensis KR-140 TaxID=695939 RepID=A0A1W1UKY3_9DEIO|nr:hypothetical protein [Deinococcus hopiensis]SMB81461.1 hypothetical protein SAMN00790413_04589 [Deinococcus hopiensis KR-140]